MVVGFLPIKPTNLVVSEEYQCDDDGDGDDDDDDDVDDEDKCQGSGKQRAVEASRLREAQKQLLPMFTGLSFFSQGQNEDS